MKDNRQTHRSIDELSGAQRQRVWITMALAQDTPVLLLDEPDRHARRPRRRRRAPSDIVTPELVQDVFGLHAAVIHCPVASTPLVIPEGGRRSETD